jgi:hypothetical protein
VSHRPKVYRRTTLPLPPLPSAASAFQRPPPCARGNWHVLANLPSACEEGSGTAGPIDNPSTFRPHARARRARLGYDRASSSSGSRRALPSTSCPIPVHACPRSRRPARTLDLSL